MCLGMNITFDRQSPLLILIALGLLFVLTELRTTGDATPTDVQDKLGSLVDQETVLVHPELTVVILRIQGGSDDVSRELVGFEHRDDETMLLILDEEITFRKDTDLFRGRHDLGRLLFKDGEGEDELLIRVNACIGLLDQDVRGRLTTQAEPGVLFETEEELRLVLETNRARGTDGPGLSGQVLFGHAGRLRHEGFVRHVFGTHRQTRALVDQPVRDRVIVPKLTFVIVLAKGFQTDLATRTVQGSSINTDKMTRQFRLDEEFTLWELIQMSRLVQMAVIVIICMKKKKSELNIFFCVGLMYHG